MDQASLPHMVVNYNNRYVASIRKGFRDAQEAQIYIRDIESRWRKPHGQDYEYYPDTPESLKQIEARSIEIHYLTPHHS